MQSYETDSVKQLCRAMLSLQSEAECLAFLDDICTIKEVQDLAQRLDTALLLHSGENYQTISRKLGISTATISRVNRCLNYGSGGYKTVISRLEPEKEAVCSPDALQKEKEINAI